MIQHDLRDWAQRQSQCHDYLLHGSKILKDGWWQLNCDLELNNPPIFHIEKSVSLNKFYQFIDKTWMLQQLVLAVPLFLIGGISWLVWGVSVRVVISVGGHWLIGYFAHNKGDKTWEVEGAAVQGHNIRVAGFLSMGEAWHNNHHAFQSSARHGLRWWELDVSYFLIVAMAKIGLVSEVKVPTKERIFEKRNS